MALTFEHLPNRSVAAQTTPASTNWTALTLPTVEPGGRAGAYLEIESVNAGGTGMGDVFQVLANQASAPTTQKGTEVPANSTYTFSGVPWNVYVKLNTSSDVINATLVY